MTLEPSAVPVSKSSSPGAPSERTSITFPRLPPAAWVEAYANAPESDETEPKGSGSGLRRKLYELHDAYRAETDNPRVEKCARVRHEPSVGIAQHGKRARLSGLIRCRSKACPVCLAHRRSEYAEQIIRTSEHWTKRHGSAAYLATFTIRHGWDDSLEQTGHGVRKAWRAFLSGRAWQKVRKRYGFQYIIAEEVTHGANGWHPHMHVLFLPTRRLSSDEVLTMASEFYERWALMVERHIGEKFIPSPERGTDFRPAGAGEYISKLGLELADPGTKRGKKGRTPIQLLDDWHTEGDTRALSLYREYEQVMRGKRDLTWSKGLRDDRDTASEELGEERKAELAGASPIATLPGQVWDNWRRTPRAHLRLLEAAEHGGLEGIVGLVEQELGSWAADAIRNRTRIAALEREAPSDIALLQVTPKLSDLMVFGGETPF